MKTDGAPIDWPDYQEAWQAWSAFEARERATHFARADSWQLVLQFDGGFVAEYVWDYRFYVCIRKSDLAERRVRSLLDGDAVHLRGLAFDWDRKGYILLPQSIS